MIPVSLITFFLKYGKYIIPVLLLIPLGFTIWGWKQSYDKSVLQARLILEQKARLVVSEEQKILDDAVIKHLEENQLKSKKSADLLKERLRDIDEAPEEDDGPVAPILRRTLDRL